MPNTDLKAIFEVKRCAENLWKIGWKKNMFPPNEFQKLFITPAQMHPTAKTLISPESKLVVVATLPQSPQAFGPGNWGKNPRPYLI
ncbi:MAG: hypothetical protein H0A76_05775 [Candidatus Thiodubiliella endoseptemdiera]|uniref:Uncharacterized protein n=1 Tax=Candidatus Thiodubiliella endoseptemdiera TaxID=2738886 RepID=A0A853F1Y7_9GAMM|nr:hypothetical protein [Candidatus Thiodubiliella endoseptemdiera]